jgi:hypothetical protein
MGNYSQLPEHVRRIIEREGEKHFTPPSFERWLGRLSMLRTVSAMVGFISVALLSIDAGLPWEMGIVRGIVAAIVFYFFAWATGLFLFGELYDVEVKRARRDLEERERERARRIEQYYRDRLREQDAAGEAEAVPGGVVPALGSVPMSGAPPAPAYSEPQRYAA